MDIFTTTLALTGVPPPGDGRLLDGKGTHPLGASVTPVPAVTQ